MNKLFKRFAGILLELPCPGCGRLTWENDNSLCKNCRARLYPIPEPRCPGCGGHNSGILLACPECLESGVRPWKQAISLFLYSGAARELILKFKFGNMPELAALFAELAAGKLTEFEDGFDCIVPVPLHFFRYLKRGYNQCGLLAAELSTATGIPVVDALGRRTAGHQSRLNRAGRLAAMKNAFRARRPLSVKGRRVLLIDDVFTTGATLTAAANALLTASPASIRVLTIARRENH